MISGAAIQGTEKILLQSNWYTILYYMLSQSLTSGCPNQELELTPWSNMGITGDRSPVKMTGQLDFSSVKICS
jgi:hypothetical protein